MVTAGFLLKELAHEHNLSVVVTVGLMLLSYLSALQYCSLFLCLHFAVLSFQNGIEDFITQSLLEI